MMKNKKRINKLTAILSVITAIIMLSTTVFASGLLSDFGTDNSTVEILLNGEKTEFTHKPYLSCGEVFLPLRETIGRLDDTAAVTWQDGTVLVSMEGFSYLLTIDSAAVSVYPPNDAPTSYEKDMQNAAYLKDDTTYVPYWFFDILSENHDKAYTITYAVYDNAAQYAAAKTWANALITRDGKPRYEMMTADQKEAFVQSQKSIGGDDWNYVIGYSSPQTLAYRIVSLNGKAEITYHQTDSTKTRYLVSETLTFAKDSEFPLVSESAPPAPAAEPGQNE